MTAWRMQLHPDEAQQSTRHVVESLCAGYVGLDFKWDIGDLEKANKEDLPPGEKVLWAFAHEMKIGDHVLVFVHHYPFALAEVCGKYNYIKTPVPEIGVWFRAVCNVRYFADFKTDMSSWKPLTMTATLTPLRSEDSGSQKLVREWLASN